MNEWSTIKHIFLKFCYTKIELTDVEISYEQETSREKTSKN